MRKKKTSFFWAALANQFSESLTKCALPHSVATQCVLGFLPSFPHDVVFAVCREDPCHRECQGDMNIENQVNALGQLPQLSVLALLVPECCVCPGSTGGDLMRKDETGWCGDGRGDATDTTVIFIFFRPLHSNVKPTEKRLLFFVTLHGHQ